MNAPQIIVLILIPKLMLFAHIVRLSLVRVSTSDLREAKREKSCGNAWHERIKAVYKQYRLRLRNYQNYSE